MDPELLSALGARTVEPGAMDGRGHTLVRLPWPGTGDRLWLPVVDGRVPPDVLALHVPCSVLGRLGKRLAASMLRVGGALGWIGDRCGLVVDDRADVPRLLAQAFPRDRIRLAIRISGDGDRRRAIVQVAGREGGPLGYLKLAIGAAAADRLRNEAVALADVHAADPVLANRTPSVMHAGALGDTYGILGTAIDGPESGIRLTPAHLEFLRRLSRIERRGVSAGALVAWVERRLSDTASGPNGDPVLPLEPEGLREQALARAAAWLRGRTVRVGRVHGDFAPWNLRVGTAGLSALDWERSEWGLPGCWDRFHFESQVRGLLGPGRCRLNEWAPPHDANRALLVLYLLDSAAWLARERGSRWRTALAFRWRALRELLV